jgi:hypothetical protein
MIMESKAGGGGDIPEDILGALDKALNLKYFAKTCLIYLIADAPCHGRQYHDLRRDSYADQPLNILEEKMKKLASLKDKNVFFHALKINNSTDKMYRIMEESFGSKFNQTDEIIPLEFFDTMFITML